MNIFRGIFRSKSKKEKEEVKSSTRGKYMPKINLPIDESFMINFKSNGGKFLYCENLNEVFDNFNAILKENDWDNKPVYFYDKNLSNKFKDIKLNTSNSIQEATFFVTTCENLIANDGSLLISSNQIAEKKLPEFPDNFIVYATTSQIVANIGEGLQQIKTRNKQKLPTNITTIKHFKGIEEKNFLTYGSATKNLYLLLLEDL